MSISTRRERFKVVILLWSKFNAWKLNSLLIFSDKKEKAPDLELFDLLPIESTMIPDLSLRTGQDLPFAILQECLSRCSTIANCRLQHKVEKLSHKVVQFTLKVGDKHEVLATGPSRPAAKQMAAQKLLAQLYPNVSLLCITRRLLKLISKWFMMSV